MAAPEGGTWTLTRNTFRGTTYEGNANGLVGWYYANLMPWVHPTPTHKLEIVINGGFHQTFPNPEHLSVTYIYDGVSSPVYHMSINDRGNFYAQPHPHARHKKQPKTKTQPKKQTKRRRRSKQKSP